MRDNTIIQAFQNFEGRIVQLENRLGSVYKVLEDIIGKELLRGQALHKVLMNKAVFTDAELKAALEQLVAESKAELEKMKKETQEAKAKAVEILIPAGANVNLPPEGPVVHPDTLAVLQKEQEAPNAEPPITT